MAGSFSDFRPGFGFFHICHVERLGHFTLEQLRSSVANETHTKSYTGPKLSATMATKLDMFLNASSHVV